MKTAFVALVLTLAYSKISAQVHFKDLVKAVNDKKHKAPVKTAAYFSTGEGWCSGTILLNDDSTFMSSGACENRSHITTGTWQVTGDSITLTSYPKHTSFIRDIKIINKEKSGYCKILINDKAGRPFTSFTFSLFNSPQRLHDTINRFYNYAGEQEDNADSNSIFSNGNAVFIIDKTGFNYLEIPAFSILQQKRFVIYTKNLPAEMHITVDFNAFYNMQGEVNYHIFDKPVKYHYTKNRLTIGKAVFETTD